MAKLTKEEMAILNSLIYIKTDLWNRSNIKLIDIIKELEMGFALEECNEYMSIKEYQELFLVVKNSPALSQLVLKNVDVKYYEEYNTLPSASRILAFENGENPIVVFKGTDGTEEWADNIIGGISIDTEAQQRALAYINILHDKYGFDNISVSGHSKGGNKAMYVTLLSDYVTDCTAFDAQGFSNDFIVKNKEQIEANKDKITLYAADKAIVHTLLFSVAGTTIYTSTEDVSTELMKALYHTPNIFFTIDSDGNILFHDSVENPSKLSMFVNKFTCYLASDVPIEDRDVIFKYVADLMLADSEFMSQEGQEKMMEILLSLEDITLNGGIQVSSPQVLAIIISYVFEFLEQEEISYDQIIMEMNDYGIDTSTIEKWWMVYAFDAVMDVAKETSPEEFASFVQSIADWGISKKKYSWKDIWAYISENPIENLIDCYAALGDDGKFIMKFISTAFSYENRSDLLYGLADKIMNNYNERNKEYIDNWLNGVNPDGSITTSTFLWEMIKEILNLPNHPFWSQLLPYEGAPYDGPSFIGALEAFEKNVPLIVAACSLSTATIGLGSLISAIGGVATTLLTIGAGVVSGLAIAVIILAVLCLVAKVLELIIPLLLNTILAGAELIGIALALAASWVVEQISQIAKAIVDGFNRVIDEAVRLGQLAKNAANVIKDAVSNAVNKFCMNLKEFFSNFAKGAASWIKGIFGSATAAIVYAQDISVTISRIDEMQRCIRNLRQCYVDIMHATNNANAIVSNVHNYYKEAYVRSCCRDIQNDIKNAQKSMCSVERDLDRKRRTLAEAVEAYRRADQNAAQNIRSGAASFT